MFQHAKKPDLAPKLTISSSDGWLKALGQHMALSFLMFFYLLLSNITYTVLICSSYDGALN